MTFEMFSDFKASDLEILTSVSFQILGKNKDRSIQCNSMLSALTGSFYRPPLCFFKESRLLLVISSGISKMLRLTKTSWVVVHCSEIT